MTVILSRPVQIGRPRSLEEIALQDEVEQFLYHEAELLDSRRFREWFDLLAEDLEYWMPVRSNRAAGDEENEFARIGEGAFFDESKELIAERIRKLETGYSWAEDPASRTRHVVTNVRVLERLGDNEIRIGCNFLLYRSRLAQEEHLFAGRREDGLRWDGDRWLIWRRHIFIDQVSLNSKNLSIFF